MDNNDLSISPSLSSSAQHRILIWRNEVASASSPSSSSSTGGTAPSLTTTTTTSTSSSPGGAGLSRRRRLWNKLTSRFRHRSGSVASGDVPDFLMMPPHKDEPVARTAMYRILPPGGEDITVDDEHDNEEILPGEASSHSGGAGRGKSLMEKQERLQRAARLLNQGAS